MLIQTKTCNLEDFNLLLWFYTVEIIMKIKTKLIKLGRNSKKNKGFINPGIYKGSTILFENYKEYLKDLKNKEASLKKLKSGQSLGKIYNVTIYF